MADLESPPVSFPSSAIDNHHPPPPPPPPLFQATITAPDSNLRLSELSVTESQFSPGAIAQLSFGMSTRDSKEEEKKEEEMVKETQVKLSATPHHPTLPLLQMPTSHRQRASFGEVYPGVESFLMRLNSQMVQAVEAKPVVPAVDLDVQTPAEKLPSAARPKLPLLNLQNGHPPPPPPCPPQKFSCLAWAHPRSPERVPIAQPSVQPAQILAQPMKQGATSRSSFLYPATHHQLPLLPGVEYAPPQVPIRPFVPQLVPPTAVPTQSTAHMEPPPLLSLSGPLSRMRQEGFQMLQLPSGSKDKDLKLVQLPAVSSGTIKPSLKRERRRIVKRVRLQLEESQQSYSGETEGKHPDYPQPPPPTSLPAACLEELDQEYKVEKSQIDRDRESGPPRLLPPPHPTEAATELVASKGGVSSSAVLLPPPPPPPGPGLGVRRLEAGCLYDSGEPVIRDKSPLALQDTATQTVHVTSSPSTSSSSPSSSTTLTESCAEVHASQYGQTAPQVSTPMDASSPPVGEEPAATVSAGVQVGGPEYLSVEDIEEEEEEEEEEEGSASWRSVSEVSTAMEEEEEEEESIQAIEVPSPMPKESPVQSDNLSMEQNSQMLKQFQLPAVGEAERYSIIVPSTQCNVW